MLQKKISAFSVANYTILAFFALVCIFPVINILAVSLSSRDAIARGEVYWWPVGITGSAYQYLMRDIKFWLAFSYALWRVLLTVALSLSVSVLAAYPLSLPEQLFPGHKQYIRLLLFTMLFNAGLIPTFLVVKTLGLIGSYAAIILPGLVAGGNIILLMNFFRQIPAELRESAMVDGASHYRILLQIILPVSRPILATIVLFVAVGTWNEWFAPIIYLNDVAKYPLQTYLRQIVLSSEFKVASTSDLSYLASISNKSLKTAQILIATIPVLLIYPFLQKYFTKGIVLGAVKE